MEKIQQMEQEKENKAGAGEINSTSLQIGKNNNFESSSYDEKNTLRFSKVDDMDMTTLHKESTTLSNRFKYSVYGKGNETVNLTQIVDENENLRELFDDINLLKKRLHGMRKNNTNISKEIANINNKVFLLSRLFNEGFHEISRELLKIHEVQLDKLLKGIHNMLLIGENDNNSVYFELVKLRNMSNNTYGLDSNEQLKLPKIMTNMEKIYKHPYLEKADPSTLIYNVIKNIVDENNSLTKSISMKKKKIPWEEFQHLSGYQIFTLLTMNKVSSYIKILEYYR
jgi:hypothetical protein